MASFLLLKGSVDPGKLFAALMVAGLTPTNPNISVLELAPKPAGWGETKTAAVRSIPDLSRLLSTDAEMTLIVWAGGTIATSWDKSYVVAVDSELDPDLAAGLRKEVIDEALWQGQASENLIAAWYAGKMIMNGVFGELLAPSVPAPRPALVPRARTGVISAAPPLPVPTRGPDHVLRKQLAPLLARTSTTTVLIDRDVRSVQVISGIGTSLARGLAGKVFFLTPSLIAARTLLPTGPAPHHFAADQINITPFGSLA